MLRWRVTAVAGIPLALGACTQASEAVPGRETPDGPTSTLTVSARGDVGSLVQVPEDVRVSGNTPVRVEVARWSGGTLQTVTGPTKSLPSAIEFPPGVATGPYPRSVLRISPTLSEALDPGPADFSFGAVFRVDKTSTGPLGQDGDNVFQRGLYSDGSMYKLEVDRHYPGCMVKGEAGEVIARSKTEIRPDTWYRVTCRRTSTDVSITVSALDGSTQPVTTVASGASGNLYFRPSLPAAVGGKLNRHGDIVHRDTDQFNGAVAEVSIALSAQRSCCLPAEAN